MLIANGNRSDSISTGAYYYLVDKRKVFSFRMWHLGKQLPVLCSIYDCHHNLIFYRIIVRIHLCYIGKLLRCVQVFRDSTCNLVHDRIKICALLILLEETFQINCRCYTLTFRMYHYAMKRKAIVLHYIVNGYLRVLLLYRQMVLDGHLHVVTKILKIKHASFSPFRLIF